METLGPGAVRSSKACQDAEAAIKKWDEMIGVLRRAVLDKQGAPPVMIAPNLGLEPTTFSLPFPEGWFPNVSSAPNLAHPFWRSALSCEACVRRFHKSLTSGDGNSPDWTFLQSPTGEQYLTVLLSKFEDNARFLSSLTDTQSLMGFPTYFNDTITVSLPHTPRIRPQKFDKRYRMYGC